jgi:hypothetical protein
MSRREGRYIKLPEGFWKSVRGMASIARREGDISPICDHLLYSGEPLSEDDRLELAGLIEWLNNRVKRRGTPRGPRSDLLAAQQGAAYLLSIGKQEYLKRHGGQRVRDQGVVKKLTAYAIALTERRFDMEEWEGDNLIRGKLAAEDVQKLEAKKREVSAQVRRAVSGARRRMRAFVEQVVSPPSGKNATRK